MKPSDIDINCDVGESNIGGYLALEKTILPLVSSCNIACGGHAGDIDQMHAVIELSRKHNVRIGAHPSYPDRANFGRLTMHLTEEALFDTITLQIYILKCIAEQHGMSLHHVKAHGALYNDAAKNENLSNILIEAVIQIDASLKIYCLPHSVTAQIAPTKGVKIWHEAFIDRLYEDDGSLVNRKYKRAVIVDHNEAGQQYASLAISKNVSTVSGKIIDINADTLCIHGDNPNVIPILKQCHKIAKENNITL